MGSCRRGDCGDCGEFVRNKFIFSDLHFFGFTFFLMNEFQSSLVSILFSNYATSGNILIFDVDLNFFLNLFFQLDSVIEVVVALYLFNQ